MINFTNGVLQPSKICRKVRNRPTQTEKIKSCPSW